MDAQHERRDSQQALSDDGAMPILTSRDSVVGQQTAVSIDWYAEGESRIVRVGKTEVVIRYVGRKGRRGRISISAPSGATFDGC